MFRLTFNFLRPVFISHSKFNAVGVDFHDRRPRTDIARRDDSVANNSTRIILAVNNAFYHRSACSFFALALWHQRPSGPLDCQE